MDRRPIAAVGPPAARPFPGRDLPGSGSPAGTVLRALVLALALYGGPPSSAADPVLASYERETGSFGLVYHRGWASSRRQDMVAFVERAVAEVERKLQRTLDRPVTVVLVPDRGELGRLVAARTGRDTPAWILGMAFPRPGWIVVRADGPPVSFLSGDSARTTLVHEIAHLVVHRRNNVRIPRWFDEGVCMYVSGNLLPPDDEAWISGLARIGGLFPLADLEERFPEHHNPGSLAYQQSLLVVRYLVESFGEDILARLLDGLDQGESLPTVFERVTGDAWSGLEEGFRRWVVARSSLLEVLGASVNLFTLISLLAIVAILVSLRKTRRLRRKLEREEPDASELVDGHDGHDGQVSPSGGDRPTGR